MRARILVPLDGSPQAERIPIPHPPGEQLRAEMVREAERVLPHRVRRTRRSRSSVFAPRSGPARVGLARHPAAVSGIPAGGTGRGGM